ncbi:MAG TPA: thioesterase domain-containing protein [Longimicrobiales bacterium]
MSDPFGLEAYLYQHIPLSRHLGVRVQRADIEAVRLVAPLEPNLNHRMTGFGGSISAVAILAGWSILWCRLRERTGGHNIVIQRNSIDYLAPVTSDFTASCVAPSAAHWKRFERAFEQRGRSRIELDVEVRVADTLAASFAGRFVALRGNTNR